MSVHLARGVRDFLPEQMAHRLSVIDTVRGAFERHGFAPLVTPAFERIETLTGKYGEEGQKLLFRIIKRGKGADTGQCDLGLRYDLTVPLARVIAMNPSLRMPFKRWQISPVWRADRPARGRYREFLQCDTDIIGATAPLADASCLAAAYDALSDLKLSSGCFRINDRRLLRAVAVAVGAEAQEVSLLITIDKLDKIGESGVNKELLKKGFDETQLQTLWKLLASNPEHSAVGALNTFCEALTEANTAPATLAEIASAQAFVTELLSHAQSLGVPPSWLQLDPTLARGLNYYTGPVFEISLEGYDGSCGGGGRYDGLIGMFGNKQFPAVGISLGLERIMLILADREISNLSLPQVLMTRFNAELTQASLIEATALRKHGLRVTLFESDGKLKQQFKYAHALKIPFVATIGPSEMEQGVITMKHMATGEQITGNSETVAAWVHQRC